MSHSGSARTLDVDLGSHEIVTIELDSLDPQPDDAIELLQDGHCKVELWNKLAQEYCKQGYFTAALSIAKSAVECTESSIDPYMWISYLPFYRPHPRKPCKHNPGVYVTC